MAVTRGLAHTHHDLPGAGLHDLRRHQVALAERRDSAADDRGVAFAPGHLERRRGVESGGVRNLHAPEDRSQLGIVSDAHVRRLVQVRDHCLTHGKAESLVSRPVVEVADDDPVPFLEEAGRGRSHRARQTAQAEMPHGQCDRGGGGACEELPLP